MARVTYSESFLWANDVDNALTAIGHAEVRQAKRLHILLKGGTLRARVWLGHKLRDSGEVLA